MYVANKDGDNIPPCTPLLILKLDDISVSHLIHTSRLEYQTMSIQTTRTETERFSNLF